MASYEYDSTGNIVSKTTEHGTYSYGYDGASRLTSVDNPTLDDEAYSYDVVGNRTNASNANGSISHNANNELIVYGDVEYVYDANGNMTEVLLDGQMMFKYVYNAGNRLMKVEGGSNNTIAEYFYDPFGRRLWKEVNGVKTYFFYSDEGLTAEYDASGTELTRYGYQPDSTWTTDPLFLRQNSEYYFYHNDHLGTPQKLTAVNGAVMWSARYSAFGQANIEIETVTNNLRFPGQYFDAETGLHYNFQRYYDPGIGRYVSADPIGFEGGIHLFEYSLNNPVNQRDPFGLYPGLEGHGNPVSPEDSITTIKNRVAVVDAPLLKEIADGWSFSKNRYKFAHLSYTINLKRLAFLAWEGIGTNEHNMFVFTCKYGWIDHGHFFKNAYGTYLTESKLWFIPSTWVLRGKWIPTIAGEFTEMGQMVVDSDSKYSPEDKVSNWLGRQFGQQMYDFDHDITKRYKRGWLPDLPVLETQLFNLVEKWESFLRDAGALNLAGDAPEYAQDVKDFIRMRDQEQFGIGITWAYTVTQSLAYKEKQQLWRCFCDGDKPKPGFGF